MAGPSWRRGLPAAAEDNGAHYGRADRRTRQGGVEAGCQARWHRSGCLGGAAVVGLKFLMLTGAFALSMFYAEILGRNPLTALTFGFLTMSVIGLIIVAILALFGKFQFGGVKAPQATIAETKASLGAISTAIEAGISDASEGRMPQDAFQVTRASCRPGVSTISRQRTGRLRSARASRRRCGHPSQRPRLAHRRGRASQRLRDVDDPAAVPVLRPAAQIEDGIGQECRETFRGTRHRIARRARRCPSGAGPFSGWPGRPGRSTASGGSPPPRPRWSGRSDRCLTSGRPPGRRRSC